MSSVMVLEMVVTILIFALLAFKLRILDIKGILLAALIGITVYSSLGRVGFALLAVFVAVAGAFTRLGYDRKRKLEAGEPGRGLRGWRNVVGNGLVSAVLSILYSLSPQNSHLLFASYVGSVSAVFSDTLATEVGLLYRGEPRLIVGFRRVRPGTPGGVTPLGYAGALLSTPLLAMTYILIDGHNPLSPQLLSFASLAAGLAGTTVDSVVGQYLQGMYRCVVCGRITEYRVHCNGKAKLVRGASSLDNHVVNIICSLCGAVVAAAVILLFYNTSL